MKIAGGCHSKACLVHYPFLPSETPYKPASTEPVERSERKTLMAPVWCKRLLCVGSVSQVLCDHLQMRPQFGFIWKLKSMDFGDLLSRRRKFSFDFANYARNEVGTSFKKYPGVGLSGLLWIGLEYLAIEGNTYWAKPSIM